MKLDEIMTCYAPLTDDQKAGLLAEVAHELTIRARGAYPGVDTAEGSLVHMMAYNEALHHITNQIGSLVRHHQLYPDDLFIRMLFEDAARGSCDRHLALAFEQALTRSTPV